MFASAKHSKPRALSTERTGRRSSDDVTEVRFMFLGAATWSNATSWPQRWLSCLQLKQLRAENQLLGQLVQELKVCPGAHTKCSLIIASASLIQKRV
jgi:hypothetical protein